MALSHQKPLSVVTKTNGISKELYEQYKAVAAAKGIKLLSHKRMPEPNGFRWLLVWDSQQDANTFCDAVNEVARAKAWAVQSISSDDLTIQIRPADGLQARVKRDEQSTVFRLDKSSISDICTLFPNVTVAGDFTIKLAIDQPLPIVEELRNHVQLWTQLNDDQIKSLGGFRMLNPVTNEVISVII